MEIQDGKYEIEYTFAFTDKEKTVRVRETVLETTLRLEPPSESIAYGRDCEVDYFVEKEGYWRPGIVCNVVNPPTPGKALEYSVLDSQIFTEKTFEEQNVRTHFDYSDGAYQPSSLNENFKTRQALKEAGLPASVDWSYLSRPPKFQAPNTCYSFTSTSVIETRYGHANGLTLDQIPVPITGYHMRTRTSKEEEVC